MNKLNHIAFIMDGNGRWGEKKNKSRNFGHYKGVETVKEIVKTSIKLKIPFLTFYVFSTENWKRPKKEINFLFKLIETFFLKEKDNIKSQGLRINFIGELSQLPLDVKNIIKETIKLTKKNKKIYINLAINYGSRKEILNTLKKTKKVNLKNFNKSLYTKKLPDPDILIRTGGHQRLSNFMLWQLAYSELFFLKKLWPDFNSNDLIRIIKKFKGIKRNFGSI